MQSKFSKVFKTITKKTAASLNNPLTSNFSSKSLSTKVIGAHLGTFNRGNQNVTSASRFTNSSHDKIASALNPVRTLSSWSKPIISDKYCSPYETTCPLQYVVIHNRSNNAVNFAIRKLKEAWPKLEIIQVVQGNDEPIYGADHVVRIKDWTCMSHFKSQFDKLALKLPDLSHSLEQGAVGFYPVYSTQAEDPEWARKA